MEFAGIRIMMRALNIKYIEQIRTKIDTAKPFNVQIGDVNYIMSLKSSKK
jgi:hypothetical protein